MNMGVKILNKIRQKYCNSAVIASPVEEDTGRSYF